MIKYLLLAVFAALGLFIIDRLGLWLEAKGWVYWRKRKSGGAGHALQEFDALFRPSARYTIEVKQKDSKQRDDQGDGPI
jgi:hypothetical protein